MSGPSMLHSAAGGLVVSCQAPSGSPLDDPFVISSMAAACIDGGAMGIRCEGVKNAAAVVSRVDSLVIGLCKGVFDCGGVRITRCIREFSDLVSVGVSCIAVDGTDRVHDGMDGPSFISLCRRRFPEVSVLADVAEFGEAEAAVEAGAHAVATTLRGHTEGTRGCSGADSVFIGRLASKGIRVVAEGGIHDPSGVRRCLDAGAYFCVVGRAITDIAHVVSQFAGKI